MKWFDIPDARDTNLTYLRRLRIIQTPWFAILLHFIYTPDLDQDPHDHPWSFRSVVLRGGYIERVYDNITNGDFRSHIVRWTRGSIHHMPVHWAHQIMSIRPRTVTLLFVGPRVREWGFWTANGFVPWKTYNTQKYGTAEKTGIARKDDPVDEFA